MRWCHGCAVRREHRPVHRRDRARFERLRTLEVVPIARRDAAGLGVAGRF